MRSSQEKRKQWQAHFAAQRESGLSVQRYCDKHQLKKHQFIYYKQQLKDEPSIESKPKLLPIVVQRPKSIQIKINGISLELDVATPPSWLAQVLMEMGR